MDLEELWLLMERRNRELNSTLKPTTGLCQRLITLSSTMSRLLTTGLTSKSLSHLSSSQMKQQQSNLLDQSDQNI